mmetsp:Transcript_46025/g.87823  ORF Transcript_46025/g.87823 Transcript_46025/m.87823 type:complete len:212 (+) Transcript_46025:252-887(+)
MSSSKPSNRHSHWGAGDFVQAHFRKEFDRCRVTSMLAANAQVQVGLDGAPFFRSHSNQLTHAVDIDCFERILGDDFQLLVRGQELVDVVTAEPVRHLCEIIGTKGEEVRELGNLPRHQCSTRQLNHSAHRNSEWLLSLSPNWASIDSVRFFFVDDLILVLQLCRHAHKGHHDPRARILAFAAQTQSSLHQRAHLHARDLGVLDAQPAPAEA